MTKERGKSQLKKVCTVRPSCRETFCDGLTQIHHNLCGTYDKTNTRNQSNTKQKVSRMKITAILLLKVVDDEEPILVGSASDLSSFGYFQRSSVRELITFASRTIAKRTPPGRRQSVEQDGDFFFSCT